MLRKPLLSLLLALVLFAGLAAGIARLFVLRYEIGDIYPPYSSLRTDPLGAKVFAAALDDLPGIEVRRNFKPLPKLRAGGPVTLVYAGVPHKAFWTEPELLAFDSLIVGGSRAVFTFLPVATPRTSDEEKSASEKERAKKKARTDNEKKADAKKKKHDKKKPDGKKPGKKSKEDVEKTESPFVEFDAVAKRWGFSFGYLPEEKGKTYDRHAALVEPGGHLESDIAWHSALYFRDLKPHWKVLYMCGTMPVVIERRYGNGTIVLAADSFFLSNEALRSDRHPQLLARLVAGPPTVIFDEEHNGIRDNPGIATLARNYHLHGVVAALLLLAALFVWKNAVRFIPAYPAAEGGGDVIAGKESSEGFVNLLRRSIRPGAIFETCLREWRKTFAHQPRELAKIENAAAQELSRPARARDPVAAYRNISRALAHH